MLLNAIRKILKCQIAIKKHQPVFSIAKDCNAILGNKNSFQYT